MAEPAYIRLTTNGFWTLFQGDGTETEQSVLAVGEAFQPGPAISAAVEALEAWARDAGYNVITPPYGCCDVELEELIEPDVYDEVFRSASDDPT
jgi:NADH:ubiquinone oxidoreductase subunit B-like Fe-S oxidoreductase